MLCVFFFDMFTSVFGHYCLNINVQHPSHYSWQVHTSSHTVPLLFDFCLWWLP